MERYLVELTGDQLDRLNGMCAKQSTPPRTKTNVNSKTFLWLCMIFAGRPGIAGATDLKKSPAEAGLSTMTSLRGFTPLAF
jgi:hypothetical protein